MTLKDAEKPIDMKNWDAINMLQLSLKMIKKILNKEKLEINFILINRISSFKNKNLAKLLNTYLNSLEYKNNPTNGINHLLALMLTKSDELPHAGTSIYRRITYLGLEPVLGSLVWFNYYDDKFRTVKSILQGSISMQFKVKPIALLKTN